MVVPAAPIVTLVPRTPAFRHAAVLLLAQQHNLTDSRTHRPTNLVAIDDGVPNGPPHLLDLLRLRAEGGRRAGGTGERQRWLAGGAGVVGTGVGVDVGVDVGMNEQEQERSLGVEHGWRRGCDGLVLKRWQAAARLWRRRRRRR